MVVQRRRSRRPPSDVSVDMGQDIDAVGVPLEAKGFALRRAVEAKYEAVNYQREEKRRKKTLKCPRTQMNAFQRVHDELQQFVLRNSGQGRRQR